MPPVGNQLFSAPATKTIKDTEHQRRYRVQAKQHHRRTHVKGGAIEQGFDDSQGHTHDIRQDEEVSPNCKEIGIRARMTSMTGSS